MIRNDTRVLDDDAWDRIMAATNGAAAACFQCGVCTATCPWPLVGGDAMNVRKLVRRAQLGVSDDAEVLWRCTTCGACEAHCPKGVEVTSVIRGLRHLAWQDRHVPPRLNALMWGMYFDGNPWGRPPSQRTAWARGLDVPAFTAESEVLLYIGCTASYDPRVQKVARALVGIFRQAGVNFGTLGEAEPCCGEAAHSLGQVDYTREIVAANQKLFAEAGVRTIVAISPHCHDMFAGQYFKHDRPPDWRPMHYSAYLAELVAGDRLRFDRPLTTRVTYHDPCYLGRRHGLYDPPRQVLASIPGVELVEMSASREDALCCGGGGGRMWQETDAGQRFGDLRVGQARETGADALVTTCPHCIACLEDSLKQSSEAPLRVLDLAEVVAAGLGIGTAVPVATGGTR
jgi:Fe-S oxidoreductase